jgi:hypothetical protein
MKTLKSFFRIAFFVLAISIIISACHPALKEPEIITHTEVVKSVKINNQEKPVLSVDTPFFESVGCPPEDLSGFNHCVKNSALKNIGCFGVFTPNPLLGGLNPKYPLIECALDGNEYLYHSGCAGQFNMGLAVYVNGNYQLIDTESKFRKMYAPIESEEEALSYALAGTGLLAYYDLEVSNEHKYYVDEVEETHVTKVGDDFLVRLFDYPLCACGYHNTYSVDVRITRDGYIEQTRKELIYQDVTYMCVD